MKKLAAIAWLVLLVACNGKNGNTILASGYIEATEIHVGTKVAGRLMTLSVDEGSIVKKDQELAKLDPVDLDLALGIAKADRDLSEADLRGAEKDFRRMENLLKTGSGTAKARDDAKTRFDIAAGRLASAKARIAQLEQQISDTVLKSPSDGTVTEKLVEPGELLSPGATIVVVTNIRDAWLTAYVTDPDLPRIRLGQEATVKTDGGVSRKGKVTFIASTAEFTPKNVQTADERVKLVYKIKISMDNTDGTFKPGMPAQAELPAQ